MLMLFAFSLKYVPKISFSNCIRQAQFTKQQQMKFFDSRYHSCSSHKLYHYAIIRTDSLYYFFGDRSIVKSDPNELRNPLILFKPLLEVTVFSINPFIVWNINIYLSYVNNTSSCHDYQLLKRARASPSNDNQSLVESA